LFGQSLYRSSVKEKACYNCDKTGILLGIVTSPTGEEKEVEETEGGRR
jgi:hypothetical protein